MNLLLARLGGLVVDVMLGSIPKDSGPYLSRMLVAPSCDTHETAENQKPWKQTTCSDCKRHKPNQIRTTNSLANPNPKLIEQSDTRSSSMFWILPCNLWKTYLWTPTVIKKKQGLKHQEDALSMLGVQFEFANQLHEPKEVAHFDSLLRSLKFHVCSENIKYY